MMMMIWMNIKMRIYSNYSVKIKIQHLIRICLMMMKNNWLKVDLKEMRGMMRRRSLWVVRTLITGEEEWKLRWINISKYKNSNNYRLYNYWYNQLHKSIQIHLSKINNPYHQLNIYINLLEDHMFLHPSRMFNLQLLHQDNNYHHF